MVRHHSELEVWKRAHQLALDIYRVTQKFPGEERYGLIAQLRRAAVAIPANLAEGGARQSRKEFLQFCYIARGSASEIDYLLLVARDLGFLSQEDYGLLNPESVRIARMLTTLIKSLRNNPPGSR